jgi:thioredoxin-dependent peroxiredoxin
MDLSIGLAAPPFSLPDQAGRLQSLSDYRGKWVVLYFYPKDDTPGCTKEACGFRDAAADFSQKNAIVIGVSKDPVVSHSKFASKYHLAFPLLSDPTTETIKNYNAWGKKKFMGREFSGTKRITYLIDPEGKIHKIYLSVDPLVHARQIIDDIQG